MRNRSMQLERSSDMASFQSTTSSWDGGKQVTSWSGVLDAPGFKNMTDRKTPGYFRAKREGRVIPVSPMNSREQVVLLEPGQTSARWRWEWYPGYYQERKLDFVSGVMCYPEPLQWLSQRIPPQVSTPNIQAHVLQAALAKAQTDAWDTGTFMAELGKTIESFTTLAGRFRRLSELYREKMLAGRVNVATAASLWLELRYAWRPMIYDLQDISKAIKRLADGVEGPLARGWETYEASPTRTSEQFRAGFYFLDATLGNDLIPTNSSLRGESSGFFEPVITATKEESSVFRATVGVQVTTRVATFLDPAITAWEVIPYSFVLDWFINVGDAIAAFSPFATGHFRYATFTEIRTTSLMLDGQCAISRPSPDWQILSGGSPFRSKLTCRIVDTMRVEASVAPNLSFRLNLDMSKIIDLVALLIGLRPKFFQTLSLAARLPKIKAQA